MNLREDDSQGKQKARRLQWSAAYLLIALMVGCASGVLLAERVYVRRVAASNGSIISNWRKVTPSITTHGS
jgi:hypothetical protein